MTLDEMLKAVEEDGQLAIDFINELDSGVWEEWDCGLFAGLDDVGLGPAEIAIAAKAVRLI